MNKTRLAGLILLGCPFAAGTALAQSAPRAAQEQHADIVASVRTFYDGNAAGGSQELADQRGLERQDLRITPSIDADIYRPLGTGYVSLNGSLGYDINARNERFDRERINGTLGAGQMVGPCGIDTTTSYRRQQSDLSSINAVPGADGLVSNTETTFSAGGMLACGGYVGFQPYAVAQFETSRNSVDQRKGSNSDSFTYGGGLMYTQPSIGEIRLFAIQRDVDFTERDQVNYFGSPELRIRSFGGQFARDIGARLGAFVMLAYTDLDRLGDYDGVDAGGFSGLTWQAKLTLRASERLSFKASAAQETTPSLNYRVDYTERNEYSLEATLVLNSRMNLSLIGSHATRDYNYTAPPLDLNLTHDRMNTISASYSIQPIGPFRVSLDAIYENRAANLDYYEYDAFSAGLTIQMQI